MPLMTSTAARSQKAKELYSVLLLYFKWSFDLRRDVLAIFFTGLKKWIALISC